MMKNKHLVNAWLLLAAVCMPLLWGLASCTPEVIPEPDPIPEPSLAEKVQGMWYVQYNATGTTCYNDTYTRVIQVLNFDGQGGGWWSKFFYEGEQDNPVERYGGNNSEGAFTFTATEPDDIKVRLSATDIPSYYASSWDIHYSEYLITALDGQETLEMRRADDQVRAHLESLSSGQYRAALPEARITGTIRYESDQMTAYIMEYPSTDPYGRPVTLSGTISFGDEVNAGAPAKGFILYNHFTAFQADECPSHGDLAVQRFIVGGGLITVSADYYGFGVTQSKPQAYCVPSVNAKASIDALLAAQKLLEAMGISWEDRIFNAGYSQGGQTTIGVLKMVTEQYPDIHLTQSFAGGGPYDIGETYRQFVSSGETAMPVTVISVVYTYNLMFRLGLPLEAIFKEPIVKQLDEWFTDKKYTMEQIEQRLGTNKVADIVQPELLDFNSDISKTLMAAVESENLCKGWTPRPDEQITIVHNEIDGAVPVANARNLVAFFESQGLPIVDDLDKEGVYVHIGNFGALMAPAHQWGAFAFVTDVVTKVGDILGIGFWVDFSKISELL